MTRSKTNRIARAWTGSWNILKNGTSPRFPQIRLILPILFAGVAIFLPPSLFAETFHLTDGRTVHGSIVAQDKDEIQIATPDGYIKVPKANIQSITGDNGPPANSSGGTLGDIMDRALAPPEGEKEEPQSATNAKSIEERNAPSIDTGSQDHQATESYNPTTAHLLSLLIPGTGQYYQGRDLPAYGFGAAFLMVASDASMARAQLTSGRSSYGRNALFFMSGMSGSLGTDFLTNMLFFDQMLATRSDYYSAVKRYNTDLAMLAGIYLWSQLDIYLNSPKEGAAFRMGPAGFQLAYTLRF